MFFSAEYLIANVALDWADVLWGYHRQLIGWRVPIAIAAARLANRPHEPLEDDLAGLDKDHDWRVGQILEDLAACAPAHDDASRNKWLYITLLWLYENRESLDDLFAKLDEVFADFNYPDEMISFAPMMPCTDGFDPRGQTASENRSGILANWTEYLEMAKARYAMINR